MLHAPVPGSRIRIRRRRWRVDRTRIDRHTVRLDVSDRDRRLTVFTPFDVPDTAGPDTRPVTVRPQQGLARLAHLLARSPHARIPAAAVDARIDIWPYQLEPLLAVLAGHRRLLIADEVGLGKTIQAGLVLAHLHSCRPAFQALIIVPAGLQAQWSEELLSRFGIRAEAIESLLSRFDAGRRLAPSYPPGVWIGSIDYLKQRHVIDALPLRPWDVVVIDEAHTTAGRSDRHEAADELGMRARHLLLLTATPHDGDVGRFGRLTRQGALPGSGDPLCVFRRTRAHVRTAPVRRVRWHMVRPTASLQHLFDALACFEKMMLARARAAQRDAAVLLLSVVRKRALSTMAALDRTLARRIAWIDAGPFGLDTTWAQPSLDFGDDDLDDGDLGTLTVDVGVPRALERTWLRRLRTLAHTAMRAEPKLAWITAIATRTREPFVLFTEYRHSLEAVEAALRHTRRLAVVHGGLGEPQRREAISRFLRGDASVLLSTDVCSQGLNLQGATRWVISVEVPWNPLRLEQRIGRVDRIGQTRRVHATLLAGSEGAESGVLGTLARRTLAVRQAAGPSSFDSLAPPPYLAVASAVVAHAPLPSQPPAAVAITACRTFVRPARTVARALARRRKLASRWRGHVGTRPCTTRLRRPLGAAGTLALVAVPILDRSGEALEQILVPLGLPCGCNIGSTRDLPDALLDVLRRRARARCRRLAALRGPAVARAIATERSITARLHAIRYPETVQLGLFRRRAALDFDDARVRAELAARDAAARAQGEADRLHLEIGQPVIVWTGHLR